MQNIFASPDISPDGIADTPRVPPQPKHNAGNTATAHSNAIRPGRQVKARDLHPGDVMQQYDWSLHVREVDVGPGVRWRSPAPSSGSDCTAPQTSRSRWRLEAPPASQEASTDRRVLALGLQSALASPTRAPGVT